MRTLNSTPSKIAFSELGADIFRFLPSLQRNVGHSTTPAPILHQEWLKEGKRRCRCELGRSANLRQSWEPESQSVELMTQREKANFACFEDLYLRGQLPVTRAIEHRVCGCTYGATSWATREEAELVASALRLGPAVRLLEIGAGAGWPALHLAKNWRCNVTLTDAIAAGLLIAQQRAVSEGIAARCCAVLSDATCLPFSAASFDAINSSDVLCCLPQKEAVLRECRRVIRAGQRMACSTIYVTPGLECEEHLTAAETAPEFVETDLDYPILFEITGWTVCDRYDRTNAFIASCSDKLQAEEDLRGELLAVVEAFELECSHTRLRRRIAALERGHLKRELFVLSA